MSLFPHRFIVSASCKWNSSGVTLRAGESYRIEPTPVGQTWKDAMITCGPSGWDGASGGFFSRALLPLLRVKKLGGHTMRYHSLIGCVGKSLDHAFLIGDGCAVRPAVDGELFAFANDAWLLYWNNQGEIAVTVSFPGATLA